MMKLAVSLGLAAVLCVGGLAGCDRSGVRNDQGAVPRGATPPYGDVAAAYNARVNRLERLACPADVSVHYEDDKGNPLKEHVDANVQAALPASVAIRLDKVGQTVFCLGSNEKKYWWFDLTGDKSALIGSHERATPEAVGSFGLPVHPLDLLELLAIKPIPEAGAEQATHAVLAWSKDGRLLGLTLPGRWSGQRRFWLDPKTYEPARVELLDRRGALLADAALSRYAEVEVAGDARVHPRIATDFQVDLPLQRATVSLRLAGPKNPGSAQRPQLFDLDGLLKYYRISKVVDVDQPRREHAAADEGHVP